MSCPQRLDISFCQGKTVDKPIIWGVYPLIYKPISQIHQSAPLLLEIPNHGLLDDWPFYITHVQGMTQVNDPSQEGQPLVRPLQPLVIDQNTVEVNSIVSLGYSAHTPNTGTIRYASYPDFANKVAYMMIRDRVGGTVLKSLNSLTPDGGIVLDNATKKIYLRLAASVTEAITWKRGVYDMEIHDTITGVVSGVCYGTVRVTREITTTE